MLNRIFWVCLLAGLIAGVLVAVVQGFTTTPLIIAAESYEGAPAEIAPHDHASAEAAATPHHHGADAVAEVGHSHDPEAWMPADGLERTLSTALSTIVTAIGFALILVAAMTVAGETITPRTATAWAVGGFLATGLAPALGLPPELPGASAAAVEARQIWWFGTVLATGFGLYLVARAPSLVSRAIGAALLVGPHVIGAPHPPVMESPVPAELAAQFASASLVVSAVLWLSIGAAVGMLWHRGEPRLAAA
ncbi:CbtA family protein [Methylobrevis albus]|uniref:CbtA family protein n=1 Tax=Methylobrevis albus TaxID=2793297 RepID=A0A931HZL3_9HYPH|nr:CbtA family protein [Methylobrevis albus]MBH0236278.1 CbtA family protein [Methylobrevis albus]